MADYIDSTQLIQLQVLGQGVAQIISFTSSAMKLNQGESANINVSLKNNSTNVDTLYCNYYVNGSLVSAWSWSQSVNPGATVPATQRVYQMGGTDATIQIRVGHYVGATPTQDATQSLVIELWAKAALANIGTNSPVESGLDAIIIYDVTNTNTQHAGSFWAGLYVDELGTTPYPGVSGANPVYMSLPAGQTQVDITITVPNVQSSITGYLLAGHVE